MKRAFYHYTEWEDFKSGMYEPPSKVSNDTGETSEERIQKAVRCLSTPHCAATIWKKSLLNGR